MAITLQRIYGPIQRAIVKAGVITGVAGGSITNKDTQGTFVANGVTPVTVADTNVGANSVILVSLSVPGGTVGAVPAVQTRTTGTGFTVAATASDTSTYFYYIVG